MQYITESQERYLPVNVLSERSSDVKFDIFMPNESGNAVNYITTIIMVMTYIRSWDV